MPERTGVCGRTQPITGTASAHYCTSPKGHEPHWHRCTCGHVWRP